MMSVFRPGLFEGKVAIVTGGGTGIGKAIARELLYLGSKVVIASRNEERLKRTAEELCRYVQPSSTGEVKVVPCNIRDEKQVTNLMEETLSSYGKIDFLVNNGGGQFMSPVANMSLKGWKAVVDTNLNGTFLCCKEAFRLWMCKNGGSIVNIIVDMSKGFPGMAHSGAARAGVHNLTMSLAVEWIRFGVRINCVAPGVVYSDTAAQNYPDPELFQRMANMLPAKRCGTTAEVAGAVSFLLSPAAAYITGTTIDVDGASSKVFVSNIPTADECSLPEYTWKDDSIPPSKL
ncbi:peroxisomal trans-2-enoyl-CoA reductase-like [Pocillopora verrucosa]|uniref:peroxisomal trans-2-enoyl-CoA reductase-like n=1 Tax=Pocillopora verrucosa TaxID=203993 RepID=UPI002797097B|nr:peroxisomal trans-2-enoyl-CoA reductase-like [Pocillopora verrucosa]